MGRYGFPVCVVLLYLLYASSPAAASDAAGRIAPPTAAISAIPVLGAAPLAVFFDAGNSSPDAVTYLWIFGDGGASTAKSLTHIYNVAGTYVATLTVTNSAGLTGESQITITVTGSGEGPVTPDVNFRWGTTSGRFSVNHNAQNQDTLSLRAVFNTVDLPRALQGLAASFSINGIFSVTGILTEEGAFQNPDRKQKPSFFIQLNVKEQSLNVSIAKADLSAALKASGVSNSAIAPPGMAVPVTFSLTVGAQSYQEIVTFRYTSANGNAGTGVVTTPDTGADGEFVIALASALETVDGNHHFFTFNGLLSLPDGKLLKAPTSGTWAFTFNQAAKVVVPFDRIKTKGDNIIYKQPDHDLNGVNTLNINTLTRRFVLKTWDLAQNPNKGGTGLPLTGDPFTDFNFAIRFDLDQPGGVPLQVVTATRLTRKSKNDAFWQTGRRGKKQ